MRRLHQILEKPVETCADRIAAIDHDGRSLSYRDLYAAVDASQQLLIEHGVCAGDRVMLIAENSVLLTAMILACSRLDAWAAPVNARLTVAELSHILHHAEPRVIVLTISASASATAHATEFGASKFHNSVLGDLAILDDLSAKPEPVLKSPAQQTGILIYTTGTMGSPKGVMVSHANTLHNIAVNVDVRNLAAGDHVYPAPPHTHIFALTVMLASLSVGATVTFLPRFDPAAVFAALANGVSVLPAVPAMYNKLLEYADRQGIDSPKTPKLRYISAGGALLDLGWKQRVEAFFGIPLQNGYGMTETTPIIAATRFDQRRNDVSVGKAVAGVDLKLLPAGDPHNDTGEILCRGPNIMLGYYRDPEGTAAVVDGEGYLHTGDVGRLADDGSLTVVGRTREVINVSGFNVYPGEVETALNQHPGVIQSAVVGRRRDDGNEDVLAFVECVTGAQVDPRKINAYVIERLSPYKRPRHIVIVDQLPAAPTGKLLKSRILETFADRVAELAALGQDKSN